MGLITCRRGCEGAVLGEGRCRDALQSGGRGHIKRKGKCGELLQSGGRGHIAEGL